MVDRRDATRRTMDRFLGRPHALGSADCGKMGIFQLRQMGKRPRIGAGGTWKSRLGAVRFMNAHGGSMAACLDGWGLPRILPAEALIGDLIEMPGEAPFGAMVVYLGNQSALGWHEEAEGCAVLRVRHPLRAWRL
ncbi:DUF6950 family protein [Stakelama tenebrarum]